MDTGQDVEIKSSSKVFWRAFPISERKDLESVAAGFDEDSAGAPLRRLSAFTRPAAIHTVAVSCHLFSAQSSGAAIDLHAFAAESGGPQPQTRGDRLQQR